MARETGLNCAVLTINSASQLAFMRDAAIDIDVDTEAATPGTSAVEINEDARYGWAVSGSQNGDTVGFAALLVLAKAATIVTLGLTSGKSGSSTYAGSGFIEDLDLDWRGPGPIAVNVTYRGQGALTIGTAV